MIKIGWGVPNLGPAGNRNNILTLAREAEQLGYDSLWAAERILYPTHPKQNGPAWDPVYKQSLGTISTLTFIAGATEKIRLGTSTFNVGFYGPVHAAKAIATLDVLSNGRAIICAGQGWSEDEFDVSNVPFNQRSGRFEEIIQAIDVLFGPDPVEFHGRYYDVPSTRIDPKPIQQPRPPLLVAGFAPKAFERAARVSDGFNPFIVPDAAQNQQLMAGLHQIWEAAGRIGKPDIRARVNHAHVTDQPIETDRMFLTGSPDQIRADLEQLEEWGVNEVFFSTTAGETGDDAIAHNMQQIVKMREAFPR